MIGGLILLATVLVVATGIGVVLRRRQGKFRTPVPASSVSASSASATSAPATSVSSATSALAPARENVLTARDIGAPLGERATLVQFSTEFCANCPPTRRMLGEVAAEHHGVELVEVDAAARLDLARRLNVYATPTVLVLGPDGAIASRASGQPRRSEVLAAVGSVLDGRQ